MLRRDLIRALLLTPLANRLRQWMPPTFVGVVSHTPGAAAIYRKAFAWAEGLTPEDSVWLREAGTVAIEDRSVVALIQQAGPALKGIRTAASIGWSDWGMKTVSGDDLGIGNLVIPSLSLIRIACLSARLHTARGRGREALVDLFAALTLAHRLGTGGVIFARLLECGGEMLAFETMGRILPALDLTTRDDLLRRLDVLPPPKPASATIGAESRFILGSLRAKLNSKGPVIGDDEWGDLGFGQEEASTLKRLTGGTHAALLAHLESTGPAFAELARRLDLPRPGCRAALDEFAESERSDHPVAAGIIESAWGVRHMVDRMIANRSMLRAGIALVHGGEPAFRTVADPFGIGPFGLDRHGTAYLIRSALKDDAKPEVTLAVGNPAGS
jgi:hypothetical protein